MYDHLELFMMTDLISFSSFVKISAVNQVSWPKSEISDTIETCYIAQFWVMLHCNIIWFISMSDILGTSQPSEKREPNENNSLNIKVRQ